MGLSLEELVRRWAEGGETFVSFKVVDGQAQMIFQRGDGGPKIFVVKENAVERL